MNEFNVIAKILIVLGIIFFLLGIFLLLIGKFPSFPTRMPGDILIKKKNFVFYFPLGLSILLSILLTLILRLFKR
ncbi:MAG: DUF2905 family protein [Atribacterota bacterium]|nr:DUF2905 family protein [Atribacterota bacterium]